MDFNKLFTLFTQAGLRPGQPADEHNEAGVGIAEMERFRVLQEQNDFLNKSMRNSGLDSFANFGKHDF